eukprot:scaffold26962_cov114-Isochrysis_galbana.AAC.3
MASAAVRAFRHAIVRRWASVGRAGGTLCSPVVMWPAGVESQCWWCVLSDPRTGMSPQARQH